MKTPMTTIEFLDRAVNIYGNCLGIIADDGTEFTYNEFNQRVNRLSNLFKKWDLEYGDRVAILSFNSHWLLECFYATNQLGIINVPLNYRLRSGEYEYILKDCEAKAVICDAELTPRIEEIRNKVPAKHFVAHDADGAEGNWEDYEELIQASSSEQPNRPEYNEDDICTINYTSGTTGDPKGVMRSFRTEHWHALILCAHFNISDSDIYLWTLPMFHVNGWGHIYAITGFGGVHVCLKKIDSQEVFNRINKFNVSYLCAAPTLLNMLISYYHETPDIVTKGDNPVRLTTAGSPPPQPTIETVENEFGWEIRQLYGLTEVSPLITTSHVPRLTTEENKYRIKRMQGVAALGTDIRVVDSEGKDVEPNGEEIGEIVVKGNQVMEGYWNKPDDTYKSFNTKLPGYFHTGDLATINENGMCEIKDREKDIIISGGENISSVEVENTLYKHPAVFQCAVIGVPSEKWGETPKAIIVPYGDEKPTEEEIIKFCKERIAGYKCVTSVEFTDSLPATATGKVQKFELRKKYWQEQDKTVG